jgi:5-oxoprolinase (ATP-hydrolysing) subunit A
MRIDLNADVGESFGAYTFGQDASLMTSITSANIAAGFHAGDPSVLRRTIRLALAHGVSIGAHPGFPDLAGFGRRELGVTPREAEDLVLYQIAAVAGMARAEGTVLTHVKAHGALYNRAALDRSLADAVVRSVSAFDPSLVLFVPPRSAMLDAAREAGLRVGIEVFADRAYESNGQLASRQKAGSVIHDLDSVVSRAVRMATERVVIGIDGSVVPVDVDTMCLHGDTPDAGRLAAEVRQALERAGVAVKPLGDATRVV